MRHKPKNDMLKLIVLIFLGLVFFRMLIKCSSLSARKKYIIPSTTSTKPMLIISISDINFEYLF